MPEAIVERNEAIERVVGMFRERLEAAFRHGQQVRMDAREGSSRLKVPQRVFEDRSVALSDLIGAAEPDGSFELHVYIGPRTK